jgi:hypothetical protein
MAVSSGTTGALAVVARSGDPRTATRDALAGLGALAKSRAKRRACVAIGLGSASFVSSAVLAETLDFLAQIGMADPDLLAIIPTRDRDAGWDVESLAARHGIPVGSLVDAWAFVEPAVAGDAHVIDSHLVPVAWQQADVRIVIAPCSTDAIEGHALILDTLRSLVPTIDGADDVDPVTDLLQAMAPDVSLLDATVTSDGLAGTSIRRAVRTGAVAASNSAVLADVVGATLLGADPLRSRLLASVVDLVGWPVDFVIRGDLTAFPGIEYPPEQLLRSTRGAPDSRAVSRVVGAAMADEGVLTSGDDVVMTLLRQAIKPWLGSSSEAAAQPAALAWTTGTAAATTGFVQAWRTTFAKDGVPRRVASLGLELGKYSARDYETAESGLRPLLQLIEGLPFDSDDLRWTHIGGAVVFEATRVVHAPYDLWIERVDVSKAISMMSDYLGGRIITVAHDKQGRPTRQAERNIYLPQPNYIAFSGGQIIDVCKLSVIRHRVDSCAIWWRTVRSPNHSAVYDDGTVAFSDNGDGRTRVVIRGRQEFTLPPSMKSFDLDLTPDVRDSLTQDAYRRFFLTTLDNFEACYEGRDFAIGRDPDEELATVGLSRLARVAEASLNDVIARTPRNAEDGSIRVSVDDHGFTHVSGTRR